MALSVERPLALHRRGRHGGRDGLYLTDAAFTFLPGPDPRRPSLMRLETGVAGRPRP